VGLYPAYEFSLSPILPSAAGACHRPSFGRCDYSEWLSAFINHGQCRPCRIESASLDESDDSAGEPFKICRYRTMYLGTDDEKSRLLDDNEIDGPLCKIRRPEAHGRSRTYRRAAARRSDHNRRGLVVAVVGPENQQAKRWVALCGSEGAY